jgi:hypothetical protein
MRNQSFECSNWKNSHNAIEKHTLEMAYYGTVIAR